MSTMQGFFGAGLDEDIVSQNAGMRKAKTLMEPKKSADEAQQTLVSNVMEGIAATHLYIRRLSIVHANAFPVNLP